MTKQAKLLASLQTGNEYTAKQITAKFGLKDPIASVRGLREQGHCIYANRVTLHDGTESTKYRLGKPTRAMIASVAKIFGARAFSHSA